MVERSLSMREVPGSIPGSSNHKLFLFFFPLPVFDLDEVADETVRCTTFHKVPSSTQKCFRVYVTKLLMEVLQERTARLLLLDLM